MKRLWILTMAVLLGAVPAGAASLPDSTSFVGLGVDEYLSDQNDISGDGTGYHFGYIRGNTIAGIKYVSGEVSDRQEIYYGIGPADGEIVPYFGAGAVSDNLDTIGLKLWTGLTLPAPEIAEDIISYAWPGFKACFFGTVGASWTRSSLDGGGSQNTLRAFHFDVSALVAF